MSAWENMSGCYSGQYSELAPGAQWSVDNSSIVSVDGDGAHGVSDGETTLSATWDSVEAEDDNIMGGGCIVASVPGDAETAAQSVCAKVTNFQRYSSSGGGDGTLSVVYHWGSTDGNVSHLTTCQVRENVAYDGPPGLFYWPYPMVATSNNPTSPPGLAGTLGQAVDNQYPPQSFSSPLSETDFTATQGYFYNCTCEDQTLHGLSGNPHSMYRYVRQRDIWLYGISKDSDGNEIELYAPPMLESLLTRMQPRRSRK